jgi:hypothetical protein
MPKPNGGRSGRNNASRLEQFPAHLTPTLRVFLSADVVGSTAMKQRDTSHGASNGRDRLLACTQWFAALQRFYIEMVRNVETVWSEFSNDSEACEEEIGPEPRLWKTIGDEVLYSKDLTNSRQLSTMIQCWITSAIATRAALREHDPRLDLKCTAWVGLFPIRNETILSTTDRATLKELIVDLTPEGVRKVMDRPSLSRNFTPDFVGPAIDIGFRLAKFSSGRKFIISLDVAYILALHLARLPADHPARSLCFRYDGREEIKGVLGGMLYPIFWIDMRDADSVEEAEDDLLGRGPLDFEAIVAFGDRFYGDKRNALFRPYVYGETETDLNVPPGDFFELLRERARPPRPKRGSSANRGARRATSRAGANGSGGPSEGPRA